MRYLILTLVVLASGCDGDLSGGGSDTTQDTHETEDTFSDIFVTDATTSPDAETEDTFATDADPTQPDISDIFSTDATDTLEPTDTADTSDTTQQPTFILEMTPGHLALPYAEVGDVAPEGFVTVDNVGNGDSVGDVLVSIVGPFEVLGNTSALEAGESRPITVRFTGDMSQIQGAEGFVTVEVDGQTQTTSVAAVVARPGLALGAWSSSPLGGSEATLHLPTAPFPHASAGYTDDSVLVFVPDGVGATQPPGIVNHFHGHNALLSVTVPGQYIVEQFSYARRDAVLVIPQGPVQAASSNFGKLEDAGGLAALTQDVMAVLYRDGLSPWATHQDVVLTSHSGGYQGTASAILRGGVSVIAAHLFDSLYARETTYRDFVMGGGILRSSYTSGGGTDDNNATLRTMFINAGITPSSSFADDDLAVSNATIGFTPASHGGSMWVERAYTRFLVESGLPPLAAAAPELRAAVSLDENTVRVSWRTEHTGPLLVRVEGSHDGAQWEVLNETENVELEVPHRPWLRLTRPPVEGFVSLPSDVYGATGREWLIVDGFDRVLGGSWTQPTHDFAARIGNALGEPFSVASDEAIERGEVLLTDFSRVIWLLGDESTSDVTFSPDARTAITAYLGSGGALIVSGAEVGYATDSAWFSSTLHTAYVSDDANTNTANGFSFGVAYPEDYPDVLSSQTTLWTYATGGGAAVGWNNQVIVIGFGLETMAQAVLAQSLPSLTAYLTP